MSNTQPNVLLGFCQCGCGEKTKLAPQSYTSRGWVRGEPIRFIRGHARRGSGVEYVIEDRGYATPCWIWQRSLTDRGYGHTGPTGGAHRAVYERERGPVAAGKELDHLCRVRECVNPAHLEPVTHATNVQRGATAKLDWEKVRAIRSSAEPLGVLAARYGVTKTCVSYARRGITWQEA